MARFPISERNGKAKLHRTLVAVGFLKCDLLAYKPGQFIRGVLHEVLAWRLCNLRSIIVLLQESHYRNRRAAWTDTRQQM